MDQRSIARPCRSVLVIKGPKSIRDLALFWRIVVAVLVALALGALTFATYRAYQGAFGDPGRLDEVRKQPLTTLARRLAAAQRQAAQDHLRHAVVAALIAVALLALATGITWFAPVNNASSSRRVCVLMNGKPVADLAGDSVSVRSIQTGVSIRRCR